MATLHDPQDHPRRRLTAAAVTGVIAGAAKAAVTWLIEHLTTGP